MLDRFEFLLSEAFVALRRNGWMTFAAVTTAAMALFLLGGLTMAYLGVAGFAKDLGEKLEVRVFVRDSIPDVQARKLGDTLLKLPEVSSIRYIPRAQGLKEFRAKHPSIDVSGLENENPLPNSYDVFVREPKAFRDVVARLQALPEVEDDGVKYPEAEQNFLADVMRTIPWLGVTLGGLMLVTSGILIYNAIRLTVVARRREIRIMQLVGATRPMVWTPMLIEGVVQGACGGLLAGFVLWLAHGLINRVIVSNMSATAVMPDFPLQQSLLVLGLVGAAYGFVCSVIAVREPWRVVGAV